MKRTTCLLLAWLAAVTAAAQSVPPALMVQTNGKATPLGLKRLQIEVRILGSFAETTSTMTFDNPGSRVLEGDLYFPLPEGATISGYALDIAGQLVDGVAVGKHEARQIYEQVVRQGIDPGLVQWTAGNHFQTRVFPVPPKGQRTVRVRYVSELIGDRETTAYHLPLKFKAPIGEFTIRVEVVKPGVPPTVAKGELANFAFGKWRESYVAETRQNAWKPTEDLVIALPKITGPRVLVEQADDGQAYFAVQDLPQRPAAVPQFSEVQRVVVFWDASGSRAGDHGREIAVLRRYLDALQVRQQVDLILLRNVASKLQRFTSAEALAAAVKALDYDGGTQLGAIGPVTDSPKPDLYLLFTDGISNFGRDEPRRLNAPLMVFSADAGANHAMLRSLAIGSGGQYFNLAQWKDADIIAQAGRLAWSFLSAAVDGAAPTDLYPQSPQAISGRFTLLGKFSGAAATVTLRYGLGTRETEHRSLNVSRAGAVQGTLLQRLWAQKRLAHLMLRQQANQAEITALGKQFGLVTPYTSLLVLDSLEQYVEHEIAPPKSLPALRVEYLRRIDTLEHQRRKQKADKLDQVLKMWEQRVKWWNTEFKYPKDFRYKGDEQPGMGGGGRSGAFYGAAPRAAAPASPPVMSPRVAFEAPAESFSTASGGMAAKSKVPADGEVSRERQPGIVIKPWEPDTPYLKELRAASDKEHWAVYMRARAVLGTSPAFFLDCADFFREHQQPALALQVLSNIAELELEEAALLRVLGHRLRQIDQIDLAVQTFERVLALRPEEPQSCRDLALVLVDRGDLPQAAHEARRADYARALELFAQIVMTHWDGRFAEIELFALEEANHLIPRAKTAGVTTIPLDPRLVKLLDVDVRIVMTWHADNTDLDLWVLEPTGERAYFGHNRTTIGGLVSRDFTQGYGPEEYMVHRAAPGMYTIQTNFFGTRATRLLGAVTLQVDIFTNYGRAKEQHKSLTLRLKEAKETITVGQIEF